MLFKCIGIYVRKTKISEICGGKIDFEIQVRVMNLWSTPDRNNPAVEGAIHMIFLDETVCLEILCNTFIPLLSVDFFFYWICFGIQNGRIHATIRKDLISKFKDEIREGCVYFFERFMVAKNDPTFKTTPHKHKLNFMRGTRVFKIHDNNVIPKNCFDFMPFQDILACTTEDRFLGRSLSCSYIDN
jgi:hypothetical protein